MLSAIEKPKFDATRYKNLNELKPEELADQELLGFDFLLHQAWDLIKAGGPLQSGETILTDEKVAVRHAEIRQEMIRRGFRHVFKDGLAVQRPAAQDASEKKEEADSLKVEVETKIDSGAASSPEPVKKGYLGKREIEDFPNLVLNEEDAVKFFKVGA